MANVRTLKLNLLGDVSDFKKGLNKAEAETKSFSGSLKSSMKTVAKSAALAGVAVAGMAVAFGVDAVKAAIADQKSQKQLQVALKNTTKATDKQVKAVEKWITKQQMQFGIADDKLRPALAKLTRATGDVSKAQNLLSLAMDVSAGTGKDLSTVTDALVKAQNGNLGSLKKLGVPLSDTIIKTKDLAGANEVLGKTYGGAAQANADTFAGKLTIFNQAIGEAKESIGTAILDAIQPFAEKWLPKISTAVTDVVDGITGKGGKGAGVALGEAIANVGSAIGMLFGAFTDDGNGKVKTFSENMQTMADTLNNVAGAIRGIGNAVNGVKGGWAAITDFISIDPNNGTGWVGTWRDAIGLDPVYGLGPRLHPEQYIKNADGTYTKKPQYRALGGPVSAGSSYIVGEHGPELFTPMGGGTITPNSRLGGGTTIINLNGIIDAESARRAIERVLQQSSIRTGAVNIQGSLI